MSDVSTQAETNIQNQYIITLPGMQESQMAYGEEGSAGNRKNKPPHLRIPEAGRLSNAKNGYPLETSLSQ